MREAIHISSHIKSNHITILPYFVKSCLGIFAVCWDGQFHFFVFMLQHFISYHIIPINAHPLIMCIPVLLELAILILWVLKGGLYKYITFPCHFPCLLSIWRFYWNSTFSIWAYPFIKKVKLVKFNVCFIGVLSFMDCHLCPSISRELIMIELRISSVSRLWISQPLLLLCSVHVLGIIWYWYAF